MVDYIKSLMYPFSNKENIIHFVIGGLLSLVWFMIVPIIFILGYLVKLVQETIRGQGNMPNWGSDLKATVIHGVIALGITLAYFILPLALSYAGTQFFGSVSITSLGSFPAVSPTAAPFLIAGTILFALMLFLYPMALIQYATTEDYRQAFNFREIFSRIRARLSGYLTTFVIAIVIFTLFLLSSFLINVFVFFILFFPLVYIVHTFTQIYIESLG